METVLKVTNLQKNFKSRIKQPGIKGSFRSLVHPEFQVINAVDNISFRVPRGELLAFIGPNGAGKSTTIKMMTGILYPDSGDISVLGLNPNRQRRQLAYRIGSVFGQKSQLWFHLPPMDSFRLLGSIYDLSPAQTQRRVDFLTEVFEIADFLKQPVRKLSLGQRIRCEMAASMIHDPEILFLDEPSIGLDVVVKRKIRELISRINTEKKVTVFLTSHDTGDIEKICKRVIIINRGQVVWDGATRDLKYSLMNKRIIDVRLDEAAELSLEGVKVIKQKDFSAKLEVDLNTVSLEQVITRLMKQARIQDIGISSVPMEEVISDIYEGVI